MNELQSEISAGVCQRGAKTGNTEGLAGGSRHKDIAFAAVDGPIEGREVAMIGYVGIVMGQHAAGKRLDLAEG